MRHFLFVLLCTLPVLAGAQTLTEAEALRLGLSRAELHDLERGTRALAEADVTAAGTWPNPTLDYERERMRTSGRANDQTWKIAQTFDISGRRGLREAAAGSAAAPYLPPNYALDAGRGEGLAVVPFSLSGKAFETDHRVRVSTPLQRKERRRQLPWPPALAVGRTGQSKTQA